MSWLIKCTNCDKKTWAANIVKLIDNCCDNMGWFRCNACDNPGYVEKSFDLQEPGEVWKPYLKGAVRLRNDPNGTYQPFVFLVSDAPNSGPSSVWFCYYKDTRPDGKLRLGHGPGGPPVLAVAEVTQLVEELKKRKLL